MDAPVSTYLDETYGYDEIALRLPNPLIFLPNLVY
jgi:hypothetical protein